MRLKILKKKKEKCFCSVVIAAAGSSARMGRDKLFEVINGKQVIIHTLLAFEHSDFIDEIVIVARPEKIRELYFLCEKNKITKLADIVVGGDTRTESVYNGVMSVSKNADLIAIHDGARPFITEDVIQKAVMLAREKNAVVPYIPLKDTVKQQEKGKVLQTLERSAYVAVQTPQVFDPVVIKAAMKNAIENNLKITDDASAVELLGVPVYLSEGDEMNIKLTTPIDLKIAELFFEIKKKNGEEDN